MQNNIIAFIVNRECLTSTQDKSYGSHNGYILIEPFHPWYGLSESEIDYKLMLGIHGSITLSRIASDCKNILSLAKVLPCSDFQSGELVEQLNAIPYWIVGFDTMHSFSKDMNEKAVIAEVEKLYLMAKYLP